MPVADTFAPEFIVVGSGAGGGMAAYMLANAGIKVVLLEAGPMYDPKKNVTQLKWPYDSPRRGASSFSPCAGSPL